MAGARGLSGALYWNVVRLKVIRVVGHIVVHYFDVILVMEGIRELACRCAECGNVGPSRLCNVY